MLFLITWLPTILIFILMLAVLVLAHEFGHFVMARRAGMIVEEFGFGFPPRLFSWKRGETRYSFNLIPLGGFVKILGEGQESKSPRAFGNGTLPARLSVIVAGVIMNFILGFVGILIIFWAGLPPMVSMPEVYGGQIVEGSGGIYIESVTDGGLASQNDIISGDLITHINSIASPKVSDLRQELAAHQKGSITVVIARGDEQTEKQIEVGDNPALGVGVIERLSRVEYTWWQVPYFALVETLKAIWYILLSLILFFRDLAVTRVVPADVLGPVGIFGITAVAVKLGFAYILNLFILLTINLGIINILPFPALDGGRLVFLIAEKLRGKRVAQAVENLIHNLGFLILIVLVILITWRDILRF